MKEWRLGRKKDTRRCPCVGGATRTASSRLSEGPIPHDVSKTKMPTLCVSIFILEAPPGIGPGMKVLQTSALPLGYGAVFCCLVILSKYMRFVKPFFFFYSDFLSGAQKREMKIKAQALHIINSIGNCISSTQSVASHQVAEENARLCRDDMLAKGEMIYALKRNDIPSLRLG